MRLNLSRSLILTLQNSFKLSNKPLETLPLKAAACLRLIFGAQMDVGIRKDLRIDVKLLKYELHNALQRKGKKNWCRYWNAFQQYIVAELSLDELNEIIHSTLSKEDGKGSSVKD